jgi:hypothetical protein
LPETTPESSPAVSVLPLSLSGGKEPKLEKTEKMPEPRRHRDFAENQPENSPEKTQEPSPYLSLSHWRRQRTKAKMPVPLSLSLSLSHRPAKKKNSQSPKSQIK